MLKASGTWRLKFKHDKLVSSFAFDFNSRRYSAVMIARTAASAGPTIPTDRNQRKTTDAAEWRAEAVKRWGTGVPPADKVPDWEVFVRSRIGRISSPRHLVY